MWAGYRIPWILIAQHCIPHTLHTHIVSCRPCAPQTLERMQQHGFRPDAFVLGRALPNSPVTPPAFHPPHPPPLCCRPWSACSSMASAPTPASTTACSARCGTQGWGPPRPRPCSSSNLPAGAWVGGWVGESVWVGEGLCMRLRVPEGCGQCEQVKQRGRRRSRRCACCGVLWPFSRAGRPVALQTATAKLNTVSC